jgi:hypothetical protein
MSWWWSALRQRYPQRARRSPISSCTRARENPSALCTNNSSLGWDCLPLNGMMGHTAAQDTIRIKILESLKHSCFIDER